MISSVTGSCVSIPEQESTLTTNVLPDDESTITSDRGNGADSPSVIMRGPQSRVTRLSNSLKRRLRLHNDELEGTSPIEQLTQHRAELLSQTPEMCFGAGSINYSLVSPTSETTTDYSPSTNASTPMVSRKVSHTRLTRKPSKASNHSSGYFSVCSGIWGYSASDIESELDADLEDDISEQEYYEKHKEFFSPRDSGSRR